MRISFLLKITLFVLIIVPISLSAQWTSTNVSEGRVDMASAVIDDNIYFIGGSKGGNTKLGIIDIYNVPTESWTAIEMPGTTARQLSFVIGKKLYIRDWNYELKLLHVYDSEMGTWSEFYTPTNLSQFIPVGNKLVGRTSSKLYFYDFETEEWTEESFGYWPGLTMAIAQDKVFLAGGNGSDEVKIFDMNDSSWSSGQLSLAREEMRAVGYESKVYFVAGEADGFVWSDRVDIYDLETETWSIDSLSLGRQRFDMTIHDDKLYVAGGQIFSFGNQFREELDVLDLKTGTWEALEMPTGRRYATVVGHEGKIYIAGGDSDQEDNLDVVEIYSTESVNTQEIDQSITTVYPNPASDQLNISSEKRMETIFIYDALGQEVLRMPTQSNSLTIKLSSFDSGLYYLKTDSNEVVKFVVE